MKHLKVCLGYGTPKDYLGGLLKEFKETPKKLRRLQNTYKLFKELHRTYVRGYLHVIKSLHRGQHKVYQEGYLRRLLRYKIPSGYLGAHLGYGRPKNYLGATYSPFLIL